MKYLANPALRVYLIAVFASGALYSGAVAAASQSVCTRLVTRMRRFPATVVKDATVSAWGMRPWITDPIVRLPQETRVYRRLASICRKQMPSGMLIQPLTNIEALQGTGLFVVNQIAGSGDCLSSMFVEWKWGGTPRVIADPPSPPFFAPCALGGNGWAHSALVLGQPAYIDGTFPDPTNSDALMYFVTWNGKTWSRPCPVSIRYRYRYEVRRLYCAGAQRLCRAAGAIAPQVRRRYTAYMVNLVNAFNGGGPLPKFRFHGALSAPARALVARARRLGIPKAIAPGHELRPPWLQHLGPYGSEYFPLLIEGKLYVGVATRSSRHRRTAYLRHHWLFIVFQAPAANSGRLRALAAFTVHRVTTGVKSIQARASG